MADRGRLQLKKKNRPEARKRAPFFFDLQAFLEKFIFYLKVLHKERDKFSSLHKERDKFNDSNSNELDRWWKAVKTLGRWDSTTHGSMPENFFLFYFRTSSFAAGKDQFWCDNREKNNFRATTVKKTISVRQAWKNQFSCDNGKKNAFRVTRQLEKKLHRDDLEAGSSLFFFLSISVHLQFDCFARCNSIGNFCFKNVFLYCTQQQPVRFKRTFVSRNAVNEQTHMVQ